MARFYSSRFQSERINCSDALQVPILDSNPLDGENAEMMYIDGQMKYYYNGEWNNIKVKRRDGSSAAAAALSSTELKNTLGGSASNGTYWYQMVDGTTQQLWTDFTTYAPYSFVMVSRLNNTSYDQRLTTAVNASDLAIVPNDTAATQISKLSDINIGGIQTGGTIRWVIAGSKATFYRMEASPKWTSDFGTSGCCSCSFFNGYDAYATPSSAPNWQTGSIHKGGCGGGQDSSGAWLTLSGIHIDDSRYYGGYAGSSSTMGNTPSPYLCGGGTNWNINGWVLMSW
jgi:hypothetical protein